MIDIILATHNGEDYLNNLLDSVFNQTSNDFHIIAGDDNSSDNTRLILESYLNKYPDRIELHYFDYAVSSAKKNFFRLLEYSKSDYIMFADQDDVWNINKINITLAEMKAAESGDFPVLVHSDLTVVDRNMVLISDSLFEMQKLPRKWDLLNRLIVQNNVTGCTVMINRKLKNLIKVRNIDNIIMHDWWLALIASAFGKIIFIDRSTVFYRQHSDNEVGAKNVMSAEYFNDRLIHRDSIKSNICDTYIQCSEFLSVYGELLRAEDRIALEQYSHLRNAGFFKRCIVINKYCLKKNSLLRKIGQIIWG